MKTLKFNKTTVLTLVIVGAVVILGGCEISIRLLNAHAKKQALIMVNDPDVGWIYPPNKEFSQKTKGINIQFKTNSLGFKDEDHAINNKNNALRILVIGDSFVSGTQMPVKAIFTTLLEQSLDKQFQKKFEVINEGINGWGIDQYYLDYLKYGKRFKSQIVIVNVLLQNDIYTNQEQLDQIYFGWKTPRKSYYTFKKQENLAIDTNQNQVLGISSISSPSMKLVKKIIPQKKAKKVQTSTFSLTQFLYDHIALFAFLSDQIKMLDHQKTLSERLYDGIPFELNLYRKNYDPNWTEAWDISKSVLLRMKKDVEKDGSIFAVSVLARRPDPNIFVKYDLTNRYHMNPEDYDLQKPERILEGFFSANNIVYANSQSYFDNYMLQHKNAQLFIPGDGHFTKEGQTVMKDFIYKELLMKTFLLKKVLLKK